MYIEMCKWVDLATTIQNLHIYTYSNVNAHLLKKHQCILLLVVTCFQNSGNADKLVWVSLSAHISVYQVLPLLSKELKSWCIFKSLRSFFVYTLIILDALFYGFSPRWVSIQVCISIIAYLLRGLEGLHESRENCTKNQCQFT